MPRRLVTLSDGRRVTGYRKTLTQRSRPTPAHELPDWHLTFSLPDGMAVRPSTKTAVPCVTVNASGQVEIVGKRRDFVIAQAVQFMRSVEPSWRGEILARVIRCDQPLVTTQAPIQRGGQNVIEIRIERSQGAQIIEGQAMWHLWDPKL